MILTEEEDVEDNDIVTFMIMMRKDLWVKVRLWLLRGLFDRTINNVDYLLPVKKWLNGEIRYNIAYEIFCKI